MQKCHKNTVLTNIYRNFVPNLKEMDSLTYIFRENFGVLKTNDIINRTQRRALNDMLKDNSVSKIKRGLYRLSDFEQDTSLIEVLNIVPCGVFCMFSAWFYYNLTTTIPHEHHIAVTQNRKIRLPKNPPIKLYYLSEKFHQSGIIQVNIHNQPVSMYDLEKSVCDAVRFRNKVGIDIAIEVVKNYVRRKDRNFEKLIKYARQLRIENILQNMIIPML